MTFILPLEIENIIFKYKHQMEMKNILQDLKKEVKKRKKYISYNYDINNKIYISYHIKTKFYIDSNGIVNKNKPDKFWNIYQSFNNKIINYKEFLYKNYIRKKIPHINEILYDLQKKNHNFYKLSDLQFLNNYYLELINIIN